MATIRDAQPEDIPTITVIYNHAVENTTAIWNSTIVDESNRLQWLTARQQAGYPVLVAVDTGNNVAGYASFGDWRAFEGYRHTVENSVYVHPDHQGKGLGGELLKALIDRAAELDKHAIIAGIEAGNVGSIRLHEKFGFRQVGLFPEVGTKFERWLDLVFMQLTLDGPTNP